MRAASCGTTDPGVLHPANVVSRITLRIFLLILGVVRSVSGGERSIGG